MDIQQLTELINTVSSSKLTEFKYEKDGVKIAMKKEQPKVVTAEQTAQQSVAKEVQVSAETVEEESGEPAGNLVKSPLVGTFYEAPSEDADAFVHVGDRVKKGQTLAIVEAMKLMNEIESEFDGVVAEVYVQNTQAVEYGQPLFRIE